MRLFEHLIKVVATLDAAAIDYALVGGLAVAVWGAPRATQDIDLLVRPEDVERILDKVKPLGFRLKAFPMTFTGGMRMQRVSRIEEGSLLTLDLLLVDENLEPVFASRQRFEVDGRPIWVASREGLIQMKVAAGRPQDALDVQSLEDLDR